VIWLLAFHLDIKYLPQMLDEASRRYLFVAVDRATRWVFMHIYGDMLDASMNCCSRPVSIAGPICRPLC